MSLIYNGNELSKVSYNGKELSSLTYNGAELLLHEEIDRTQYCYFQQSGNDPEIAFPSSGLSLSNGNYVWNEFKIANSGTYSTQGNYPPYKALCASSTQGNSYRGPASNAYVRLTFPFEVEVFYIWYMTGNASGYGLKTGEIRVGYASNFDSNSVAYTFSGGCAGSYTFAPTRGDTVQFKITSRQQLTGKKYGWTEFNTFRYKFFARASDIAKWEAKYNKTFIRHAV